MLLTITFKHFISILVLFCVTMPSCSCTRTEYNVKFSSLSYISLFHLLFSFALIRVINSLIRRAGAVVLLFLQFIRRADNHSGSGCAFVTKFFFLCTFVNSACRNTWDTSMKSYNQGLYFIIILLYSSKISEQFMGTL